MQMLFMLLISARAVFALSCAIAHAVDMFILLMMLVRCAASVSMQSVLPRTDCMPDDASPIGFSGV